MSNYLTEHYRKLSQQYDELWSYYSQFVTTMARDICDRLQAKQSDRIVDIGGGTGLYAKAIADLLTPDCKNNFASPNKRISIICQCLEIIRTKSAGLSRFCEANGENRIEYYRRYGRLSPGHRSRSLSEYGENALYVPFVTFYRC